MNYSFALEFEKELKALSKKWRSLRDDIEYVKPRIELLYHSEPSLSLEEYRDAFFNNRRATILHTTKDGIEIIKMRLDCAALGNKDILRLVFVYAKYGETIEFIELYSKNEKQREDHSRIRKYL